LLIIAQYIYFISIAELFKKRIVELISILVNLLFPVDVIYIGLFIF